MSKRKVSTCKLCLADNVEMAKAHVIPKSLYGDALKDPSGPAKIITNTPGQHPRRTPAGVYDTDIVCRDCEKRFGPWDDYVNKLLMQTAPDELIEHEGELGAYVYYNPIYPLLKLFFISLLWRAHHATHVLFAGVRVGRKFESRLREMILTSNPGRPEEFSVVLARFDDELANGFLHPFHERYDGVGVYRFFSSQHVAYIKVTNRDTAKDFKKIILSPGRHLQLIARDFRSSKELVAMREVFRDTGQ